MATVGATSLAPAAAPPVEMPHVVATAAVSHSFEPSTVPRPVASTAPPQHDYLGEAYAEKASHFYDAAPPQRVQSAHVAECPCVKTGG